MSDLNPLSKNFTIKSLLKFAFPTILMMIFMGLYTVVDTIFVARFVDINALSALNIVCPVINLIVGLGTMIATGGSAIVARKMGAGEQKRAEQDFTLIISVGILFGVFYLAYCQYMARRGGDNINHNAHFYGAVYGFIYPILLEPHLFRVFLGYFGL